jgi:hypothetical protein
MKKALELLDPVTVANEQQITINVEINGKQGTATQTYATGSLLYKDVAIDTTTTSSHVGRASPIECSHEPVLPSDPVPSIPAVKVWQLSEDAQISLLGIGTLAEVLQAAKELVQTPGEQFRSSTDVKGGVKPGHCGGAKAGQ